MNDLNKIFGGLGMMEKSFAKANDFNSLMALSKPLIVPNWFHLKKDNYSLLASNGNALDIWKSMINVSKSIDNSHISELMISKYPYNFPKLNPSISASTSFLSNSIDWYNVAKSYSNLNRTNDWSKMLGISAANEILSKDYFKNFWYEPNTVWVDKLSTRSVPDKKKEQESMTYEIKRFAENVATLYSEIESFDETQKNKFATNINDVLTYEVQATDEFSFPFILDFILNKYNLAIESAFISNNITELNNIYSKLKAITFVGWIAIILSTSAFGIIENQAGNFYEEITGTNNLPPQFNITFNAQTNSSRPLRIEPDGRSKMICEVPDCTDVQLGEIVNKYVHVTFLNNGSLTKGWCINKEFVIKD